MICALGCVTTVPYTRYWWLALCVGDRRKVLFWS